MCGRTALSASPEDLREAFGLDEVPSLRPRYNVPPSEPLAIVRVARDTGRRHLDLVRWGLVPHWAKDGPNGPIGKISHKLTLARIEGILTSSAFRDAVRRRRCLVVIDGFYEWRRDGARLKQPFVIRRPDHRPFALAGIWERTHTADGEVLESCAIVTQPARPPVDAVHDRMPLVLDPDTWERWLDPQPADEQGLAQLLVPQAPALETKAVGPRVNDPRHDDPGCLEPPEAEQLQLVR